MNKAVFTFTAVAILLPSSILPVVGSEKQMENNKIVEVPVQIYTLHGVKEIKKELPVNEAKELFSLSNETAEAVKMLVNQHSTLKEKIRANEIVDSFLYKMKEYGLLGDLTIKQAKELITGKYLQKERNSIEMRKMAMMANLLKNNGWKINAMAILDTDPTVDIFPWNALLWYIITHTSSDTIATIAAILLTLDLIPHPTTIGYWMVYGYIYTVGVLGKKEVEGGPAYAITIGFTGVVIHLLYAIGFCPFVAIKGEE